MLRVGRQTFELKCRSLDERLPRPRRAHDDRRGRRRLSQALLFAQAGVEATAVPFDGGAPTLTAVLGGQVDVASVQLGMAAAL